MTAHYSVEKRADLPVVIAEYFEDFGGDDDVNGVGEALHAVFDQLDHDAYIILDVRRATLSFNDMMLTTKRSFFIENPLSKHPRFLKTIILTESKIIIRFASGLNSAPFGNMHVPIYVTLEEAIDWIRSDLRKRAS
ncbi:MAG: hypothetical protein KC546_09845 [Anaerolineae bacterium]|nr:hypothetical protein [Anaerolineae bacterium]MCA9888665.1 hypothetical protein [Anaerolineae bacterium]MCA9893689.1 hypothetical protein [Anaerolineae bacterium]MCB9460246.1 hypothetical protein [Anaerolineaceae bacterium]